MRRDTLIALMPALVMRVHPRRSSSTGLLPPRASSTARWLSVRLDDSDMGMMIRRHIIGDETTASRHERQTLATRTSSWISRWLHDAKKQRKMFRGG